MSIANVFERQMLDLINGERTSRGLEPLQLEQRLNESAEDHSAWMNSSSVFSHTGVGGSSATQRMRDAGFDFSGGWASGENIAWQSERGAPGISDDVVDLHIALMNSPGHRANILSDRFDYVGIGIVEGTFRGWEGVMITQNFAATAGTVVLDTGASTPASGAAQATVAQPAVGINGLEYIASHGDLIAAFGANAAAGLDHFINHGRQEGRNISFDGLEYIASHDDLISALGANDDAGATHYIYQGHREGRAVSFDALEYIASHIDLIAAFGTDSTAGATHFINYGRGEGRSVSFDGLEYIASYDDLIATFGTNDDAGSTHFINHGRGEGRSVSFDGLQYIASHSDLIAAFGTDAAAGAAHFINQGQSEGRSRDAFNAQQYLENYNDLAAAFGSDLEAATQHYILYGFAEGRTDEFMFG